MTTPPPFDTTRIAIDAQIIHRRVGDEVFALMPDGAIHWFKNATAVAVFDRLRDAGETGAAFGDLVAAVVAGFEVERARAQADLRAFVGRLVDLGVADLTEPDRPRGAD